MLISLLRRLLINIERNTLALGSAPSRAITDPVALPERFPVQESDLSESFPIKRSRCIRVDKQGFNNIAENVSTSFPDHQLASYLATVEDPVNVRRQYWFQVQIGSITLDCRMGPTIVRRWSSKGRQKYTNLPISDGFSIAVVLHNDNLIPGRLSFLWCALYKLARLPTLSLRFNLHFLQCLREERTLLNAIRLGDAAYIRQTLSSGKVHVSSVTSRGDTLLHVSSSIYAPDHFS